MNGLEGRRILVTRSQTQAHSLIHQIERIGGEAIHIPLLSFKINDSEDNQKILHQLHDFSWVFLTSSNGVKFFLELAEKHKISIPPHLQFAIIGKKTGRTLKEHGFTPDFVPSLFQGSVMVEEFLCKNEAPGKVLYVRGSRSRKEIPDLLCNKEILFQSLTAYDTLLVEEEKDRLTSLLSQKKLDSITFTSPSTVKAYKWMVASEKDQGLGLPCFCIGPTTARAAEDEGFTAIRTPKQYTTEHLVSEINRYFSLERI